MSFRFSAGTLDTMAGVFAPPKKYRLGSGGGNGGKAKGGGTILAMAVSPMVSKRGGPARSGARPGAQVKHAFGGGAHGAVHGRAVGTMERTARRAPEVVVRITGRQTGGGHVLANFTYISRLGHGPEKQLELYTSDGDVLQDGRDMQILAQDWHEWEMGDDARRQGATSISMILSMPSGTDPDRLREAALDFAREEFANRSWVASLHVDRDHPHVHVTFARRDHDGRRFHPNRDDLFRYRQRFAQKLRDRGIDANATPAKARGIDPKHEPIAARKVREKGQVPRIDKSRDDRAQRLAGGGVADPVKAMLSGQQATVREAYERSIAELSASPSLANQVIARSLEKFVASMQPAEPNSVRARHRPSADRSTQTGPEARSIRADGSARSDTLAAAIARSKAMRDQIDATRNALPEPAGPQTDGDKSRPPTVSDRLRSLLDEAGRQSTDAPATKADEIIRRTQERDRAQREQDRSRNKDGPKR